MLMGLEWKSMIELSPKSCKAFRRRGEGEQVTEETLCNKIQG